jgi:hypothetical protein
VAVAWRNENDDMIESPESKRSEEGTNTNSTKTAGGKHSKSVLNAGKIEVTVNFDLNL